MSPKQESVQEKELMTLAAELGLSVLGVEESGESKSVNEIFESPPYLTKSYLELT